MIDTTYTPDYEIAIELTLKHEGGYADHPNDTGGITNMGVTKTALEAYNKHTGKDWTVPTLTRAQAREFFFDEYWVPLQLHHIHDQSLKNVVFATAVNRGKFGAIHSLQECAGMPKHQLDGRMGPKTIAYVNAYPDQKKLTNLYCDFQRDAYMRMADMYYVKDPEYGWRPCMKPTTGAVQKNKVFERGWLRRINSFVVV